MEEKERVRRPIPERVEPNRNILGALGQSDPKNAETGKNSKLQQNQSATIHPLGPGFTDNGENSPPDSSADDNARSYIDKSVRAASELIDAHIRQGQQTAHDINSGISGSASTQSDLPELLTGLMRAYSDVAAVWVEVAGKLAQNLKNSDSEPKSSARQNSGTQNISIRLNCNKPIEASLEMFSQSTDLVPQPLNATDNATTSPITEVAYETSNSGDGGKIFININPEQPAGTYHGLILSSEGLIPVGIITIRISDGKTDGIEV